MTPEGTKTEWPKISLVTAVYNGARFLPETLASIRAQNYPNLEYIVYDGGSTDGTLEILQQNRDLIHVLVSEKDQGMYDALNKGFGRASGKIFGWLGADDLLMPWCLRTVADYFNKNSGCQWVTGIPTKFDANGNMIWVNPVTPRYRRAWIRRRWYSSFGLGVIQQESTFFKRELYEKAGGLQACASLKIAGDFDLWCRFAEYADLHQIGVFLAGYRYHGANAGASFAKYIEEGRITKIPCGLTLGDCYSFATMLTNKLRRFY
jgi:glycosyltransferase involved in cell wall biosynthesis